MNWLLVASVFSALYLAAGIIFFEYRNKQYSAVKHSISELGATGERDEKLVGYGLFLPVGIALLALALAATNDILKALSACIATGYITAAFFPCDAGSPATGTVKQQVHNIGGFVEYAGASFFLLRASENGERLFFIDYKIIAFIVIACMIGISFSSPVRGLIQRVAEVLLFGGVIAMAAGL